LVFSSFRPFSSGNLQAHSFFQVRRSPTFPLFYQPLLGALRFYIIVFGKSSVKEW
jgi:hypothetical protein